MPVCSGGDSTLRMPSSIRIGGGTCQQDVFSKGITAAGFVSLIQKPLAPDVSVLCLAALEEIFPVAAVGKVEFSF